MINKDIMFYIYLFGLLDWVANSRLDGVHTAVVRIMCVHTHVVLVLPAAIHGTRVLVVY
jgi:hypothetical protein